MKKKTFEIPIYFGQLAVISTKKMKSINKKYGTNLGEDVDACVFTCVNKKGKLQYVAVFGPRTDNSVIAHEAVHVVNMVFQYKGVKLDTQNDEAQAYFTEWVFKQCEDTIFPKEKLNSNK